MPYIDKYFKPNLKDARKRHKSDVHELKFELKESHQKLGLHKTYQIHTYGCQGNEADSEIMAGILEQMGFTKAKIKMPRNYQQSY